MSSENRKMIGYEEISNNSDLQDAVTNLLCQFPNGTVSDLLHIFFSNKDGVPKDVLDYFCESDFFSLFVDDAAEIVRKLIDFKAERGWYELIGDVCRNQKSVALYCKEIYHCFTQNYSISETKKLYKISEKPSDISTARRKNKQDTKVTTINKQKGDHSNKQYSDPDPEFLACYEKLNQNYADLNDKFQNLSKEYHGFGSYLALLMEDNKKIRAAHFECQMELAAEKQRNAVLQTRIREQEGIKAELQTLLQQLRKEEETPQRLDSLFSADKVELMIEKSNQIIEMISQLSTVPQSLDEAEQVDLEEDFITDEDLDFVPDLTEEELNALQSSNELSVAEQFELATGFTDNDFGEYEDEFGMPDENTLNELSGTLPDVETILFDPEKGDDLSMGDEVKEQLVHGVADTEDDGQTVSLDLSE